jgi:hypothetical protein
MQNIDIVAASGHPKVCVPNPQIMRCDSLQDNCRIMTMAGKLAMQ